MKRIINILSLMGVVVGLLFACQTYASPILKVSPYAVNALHKTQFNINNQFSSDIIVSIKEFGQSLFGIAQGVNETLYSDSVVMPELGFQIKAGSQVLFPLSGRGYEEIKNFSQITVSGTPGDYKITITPLLSK